MYCPSCLETMDKSSACLVCTACEDCCDCTHHDMKAGFDADEMGEDPEYEEEDEIEFERRQRG